MSNEILSIEKQICTYEQSKELAELLDEYAPESLWTWTWSGTSFTPCLSNRIPRRWRRRLFPPAYTGDELGVLLPSTITDEDLFFGLIKVDCEIPYTAFYRHCTFMDLDYENAEYIEWNKDNIQMDAKYEAHAKANLAIYLLVKKIIKPEEFKYE